MGTRRILPIPYVLVFALVVLHHDVWNRDRLEPLAFGWIPFDLAYHLAWMGAAWLVLLHLCAKVWKEEDAP
jgi:hypothetical protein